MATKPFRTGAPSLRWPVDLVTAELSGLIETAPTGATAPGHVAAEPRRWSQEVEHFLREVFDGDAPVRDWEAVWYSGRREYDEAPVRQAVAWLRELQAFVAAPAETDTRPAYWTQRREASRPLGLRRTAADFASAVADLEQAGYLVWAFGQSCVDQELHGVLGDDPAGALHLALGRDGLWPPALHHASYALDDLADVMEFLADQVRRPTRSYRHSHPDCGWHFDGFDPARGLQVYRAKINDILHRSDLGLELGEHGRLMQTASPGLRELVSDSLAQPSVHAPDTEELRHAVDLFRARNATGLDRRHAVIALAGILERRRSLVDDTLLKKDASELFTIANRYGIRHQKADQRVAYEPHLYLEWVFYLFLSVIHLTDRVIGEQRSSRPAPE